MIARREQRAAEAACRESQRGVLHDEQDTATDDDQLPPLAPVLLGFALMLVMWCAVIAWGIPALVDKVFQ